ncbi:MAG: MoaD/ThiS family protein [Candidatus Bathyarchaeia archaeon]
MPISVKIFGSLREAFGSGKISINMNGKRDVASIIRELTSRYSELAEYLIDPVLGNPYPNSLILLNGVDINNLGGLETVVDENAKLVILSVTHGG